MDYLKTNYPNAELQASGGYVGLPDGQMGNSETGHLNIGAGRIVYQDLVKINRACADNSILENPEIKAAYSYAKATGKKLHLMGLTSTGGVHSSRATLQTLIVNCCNSICFSRSFLYACEGTKKKAECKRKARFSSFEEDFFVFANSGVCTCYLGESARASPKA